MATKETIFAILLVSIVVSVKASTQVNCTEIIKQQPIEYCHMFLSRFESAIQLAEKKQQNSLDSLLQHCCQQLGKLDKRCRCVDIREFVHVQQGGGWDAPRMKRLLQEAPILQKTCSLGSEICHI
ncbi:2S sulfur-rich seed storage protein 2-like [Rutidosis leptorrhynchoides]|uniref:2S sulfur-rich seed storage protein 2-like n=1 Tax=Rutidosis leptorrhynchoides TaxID=125765 RepID=UPI003A99E620